MAQADAIVGYLNGGPANRVALPGLLAAWDRPEQKSQPSLLAEGDLDGDGSNEIALFLTSSTEQDQYPFGSRGLLAVLRRRGGRFERLSVPEGEAGPFTAGPKLLRLADLNGDQRAELAFVLQTCGAHTCYERPRIAGWVGDRLVLLTPPDLEMAYPSITLTDLDRNGTFELVLEGGLIGSVGAGPQRARREVYRWQGRRWELAERSYAPSQERYFVLQDAGQAYARGDLSTALRLYRRAAQDDGLIETAYGHSVPPGPDLRAFARFRYIVASAIAGQEDEARAALEEAGRKDATTPFSRLSLAFWDTYAMTADAAVACRNVTQLVEQDPKTVLRSLNDWGYANPTIEPGQVCELPGSGAGLGVRRSDLAAEGPKIAVGEVET